MATYDDELTLIDHTFIEDEIGNQIPTPVKTKILCDVQSVGRTEFYRAAVTDLRPEMIFLVHSYEYNGERKVEFKGQQYSVLRTFSKGFEEIELTCERVRADG
ncbi:phage head closure protein [Planococcus rifietoensis]|uniref:phage head closure protein n=1 Tax=Planococcus rifietoensis TaxID=200991 RepID=UPI003850F34D